MTTPPAPTPPLPPPLPPAGRREWLPLAVGASVLAVALVAVLVSGAFSGDSPAGASTTTATTTTFVVTTTNEVTTTYQTTTTGAGTSTTTTAAATTTTAGSAVLFEDRFEGASTATPLFGPAFMRLAITDRGRGRIDAVQGGFVLPAMYPVPVGDVQVAFTMRPETRGAEGGAGLIVFADDPSDGALTDYVLIEVVEGSGRVDIARFSGGLWQPTQSAPIPPEAVLQPDGFNEVVVTLQGGTVEVSLNGVPVISWIGPAPTGDSFIGIVVSAELVDDAAVFDDLVVSAL